ncbi:MAG: type I secretion system permease/ATPase [Aquabacterium sp.]
MVDSAHARSATASSHLADPLEAVIRQCRGGLVAVGIFSFFLNLLMLALPLYTLQLFDRVMSSRSIDTLLMLTLVLGGLFLVQGALSHVRSVLLTRIGLRVDAAVSGPALEASMRQATERGSVSLQGLRDAVEVRTFLTSGGLNAVFDLPWMPIYLFVIYLFHPLLGYLAFLGALLLFGLTLANAAWTREAQERGNEIGLRAMARVDSYLRAADVASAMGMRAGVRRKWAEAHTVALGFQQLVADRTAVLANIIKVARLTLQGGLMAAGTWLALNNEMTAGAMIAASIIMGRALAPVETAIGSWKPLQSARDAYGRLKRQMRELAPEGGLSALPRPAGRLEVDKLYFTIPGTDRHVLKGLAFAVQPGAALGIVGPSGAGKTTLTRLICGLLRPTLGHVRLDGIDVFAWSADERGRWFGYVSQEPVVVAGSVRENIARLSEPDDGEVVRVAKLAGVHDAILRLPQGYDTELGEGAIVLSGGMRQRLSIARALYGNPPLLVMDEPTTHLDPSGEEHLARVLGAVRQAGQTLIMVSHRISLITKLDRLAVLRDGRIERIGTPQEITKEFRAALPSGPAPAPAAPTAGAAARAPAAAQNG